MRPELRIPEHRPKHTLMALAYGGILLAWLTPEDATVIVVSFLGAGLSLVVVCLALLRWAGGYTLTAGQWLPGMIIIGGVIGFGAVWWTIGLMIFKNAWHSHAFPDFPGVVIVGIGRRVIPWTTAGALIGGGVGLLRLALISSFS